MATYGQARQSDRGSWRHSCVSPIPRRCCRTASYTLVLLRSDTAAAPLATRAFATTKFSPDTSSGHKYIANRDAVTAEIEDDDTLIVAVAEMEIPDTQWGEEAARTAAVVADQPGVTQPTRT